MDAMFSGISSGSGGGAHMSRAQAQLLGIQSDYSTGSRPQSRGPGPAGPSSRSTGGGFTGDPRLDLESLPVERLEALMTDEAALKQFLTTWLSSTAAAKAVEDTKQQNVTIAQENISLQNNIDEARTHVAIVRSGDYASAKDVFDDLYRRQEAVLAKLSPAVLLAALKQEADKLEEESDQLEEAFEGGSMSVEALVEQYVAKRTAFHAADLKRQTAEHTPPHLLC